MLCIRMRRGMDVWSSGAREARYTCVDMEVESKALEVPCRRADVEVGSSGVVMQVCRRGGMEFGGSGDTLQACRRRGMELGSSGGALRACMCGGMELGSSGGAL